MIFFAFAANTLFAQTNNDIVVKLIGDEVSLDSAITAKILKEVPGKKFFVDTGNKGNIDVFYMIDTNQRHDSHLQPILGEVVDEDGDMPQIGHGDIDSEMLGKIKKSQYNWYGEYEKRFVLEINNPDNRFLGNHPIIIDIGKICKEIPDFNPLNYALVKVERHIDYHLIPSQVDDIDEDNIPDELVLVHSLDPSSALKLYCYYSPTGSLTIQYPKKADTHRDWTKRRWAIAWESNWCAYSFYDGKIDFYAKRLEGLQVKKFGKGISYHEENDWGMDALLVYETSGLGGITIWEGATPVPAIKQNEESKIQIDRKIISSGPVRSLIKVTMDNIFSETKEYTVTMFMSAFAENRFSKQDIIITAGEMDSVVYSPGIEKLPNDEWHIDTNAGMFANWGVMDPVIKEIGLGLMFFPDQYEGFSENNLDRFVKLKIPTGKKCSHYVVGGWGKGFCSSPALTGTDWVEKVEELGLRLRTPVKVQYKDLESRHKKY